MAIHRAVNRYSRSEPTVKRRIPIFCVGRTAGTLPQTASSAMWRSAPRNTHRSKVRNILLPMYVSLWRSAPIRAR